MDPQQQSSAGHVVSGRLLTVPNVLSLLRLVGLPFLLWAILTERDLLALVVLMLSGLTDYADGKIARRFNMESRLGQFLDPVADRLYILATLLGLAWRDLIPWWLVVALLARELVMAVMLLYLRVRGQTGMPVHFVGKAATFNLLCAFPFLLLADRTDWLGEVALPIGWGLAWWGLALYWFGALLYAVQARLVLARSPRVVTS